MYSYQVSSESHNSRLVVGREESWAGVRFGRTPASPAPATGGRCFSRPLDDKVSRSHVFDLLGKHEGRLQVKDRIEALVGRPLAEVVWRLEWAGLKRQK